MGSVLKNSEEGNKQSVLLEIAVAIASIRAKEELLKLMIDKIKPVLGFYNTGVVIISKDGESYTDWSAFYDIDSDTNEMVRNDFFVKNPYAVPVCNSHLEFLLKQMSGYVFDWATYGKYADKELLEPIYEAGIRESLTFPLLNGDRIMGILCLNYKEYRDYDSEQLLLFRSIANLVSIGVANTLANEEILEIEKEKEKLLAISEALSFARSPDDLYKVIYNQVKQLLLFESSELFKINEEENYHQLIITSEMFGFENETGTQEKLQYKDSGVEFISKRFGTVTLDELVKTYPGHPHYPMLQKIGIKEFLYGPLKNRGKLIGAMCIQTTQENTYNNDHIRIFKNVAEQVSVAVANILANEEILEREQEKTKLLQISGHIAKSQNRRQLLETIYKNIKNIFPFDDAGLFTLDASGEYHRDWIVEDSVTELSHQINMAGVNGWIPHKNSALAIVMTDTSVLTDFESSGKEIERHPHYQLMRSYGIKQLIHRALFDKDKKIGMICFNSKQRNFYTEKDFSLFDSIASQINVAVLNILANEEIINKNEELEKLKKQLEVENAYLSEELKLNYNFEEIIGDSPTIHEVFTKVGQVARTSSTVLLEGETGTGKELVARAIHNLSHRKDKILVKVNCAAIPEALVESELFGHERGAFTGATEKRIGKFELANGGTIFLDEIGEMSLQLQAKLLRVMQEREIERLGGKGTIKLDVRIIAATNRNLADEAAKGNFRSDLYFRLNVFPIYLPPLRERKEDIPALVRYFIKKYNSKIGKNVKSVSDKALEELTRYSFPGNIRELEHIIEHAIITTNKTKLELGRPLLSFKSPTKTLQEFAVKTMQEMERDHILETLKRTSGKVSGAGGAAEILALPSSTLNSRIKKLGIKKEHVAKSGESMR